VEATCVREDLGKWVASAKGEDSGRLIAVGTGTCVETRGEDLDVMEEREGRAPMLSENDREPLSKAWSFSLASP
jgi:hypothetical protein